tara:strand:+ start:2827 stop:4626 length:1800 start_codon:yes stop_codon:yes gene_type:complete
MHINKISIFGYTLKALYRRARYFIYLKVTWFIYKSSLPVSSTYGTYIDKFSFIESISESSLIIPKKLSSYNLKRPSKEDIEDILNNRIEIFNYCILDKDNFSRIDPITGFRWPKNKWYRDARKDLIKGTDIKRPWEYSRLYQLITIAMEYTRTKEDRLVEYIIKEIISWNDDNPVCSAPNWSCTMEVSIRLANISIAYKLTSSSELYKNYHEKILEILNNHIGFIFNNLENISKITSNHYCANISGLYCALSNFPLTRKGKSIFKFSKSELEKEIQIQTLDDGWNFELSSSYHRLVFEFFFYPIFLSADNTFSKEYYSKLYSMNQVLNDLIKPNGDLVQIGDNDSGRFIIFQNFSSIGNLQASDQIKIYNQFFSYKTKEKKFLHPNADIFGYKSSNLYLIFKGGKKGQAGFGGHSHNDTFSIDLQINNKDIILDPGTGSYTASKHIRNIFRSNSRHNTVFWEGVEESNLDQGLFNLTQENQYSIKTIYDKNKITFSGINAYKSRWHKRQVCLDIDNKLITISDTVSHNDAIIRFISNEIIKKLSKNSFKIADVIFEFDKSTYVIIEDGYYSPKYGCIESANMVSLSIPNKEFKVLISLP